MADANIKVDPKQLKNYSNNIKTGYKNMYSYLSESKTAVKNLRSTWTGSGSAEFYSRFDAIIGKCEEVLNVVNTYALPCRKLQMYTVPMRRRSPVLQVN